MKETMKKIEMLYTEKNITKEEIQKIAGSLKTTFPDSFIEFYLLNNGGVPEVEDSFVYNDGWAVVTVGSFYAMAIADTKDQLSLESTYSMFMKQNRFPKHYLPFAYDEGSNQICLNLNTGEIVIIFLDLGPVTEETIDFLAPNFETFINELGELDEDEDDEDDE